MLQQYSTCQYYPAHRKGYDSQLATKLLLCSLYALFGVLTELRRAEAPLILPTSLKSCFEQSCWQLVK